MRVPGVAGDRKTVGVMSPSPQALSVPGHSAGWLRMGVMILGDAMPVVAQRERDHRLYVEDRDHRVLRARAEGKVCCNGTLIRSATGFCVFLARVCGLLRPQECGAEDRDQTPHGPEDGRAHRHECLHGMRPPGEGSQQRRCMLRVTTIGIGTCGACVLVVSNAAARRCCVRVRFMTMPFPCDCRDDCSFHHFEIARLPALVEPPLQRRVEPEDHVPALARHVWTQLPSCPAGAFGPNHTVTEPSAFVFTSGRVLSRPASFWSVSRNERCWLS